MTDPWWGFSAALRARTFLVQAWRRQVSAHRADELRSRAARHEAASPAFAKDLRCAAFRLEGQPSLIRSARALSPPEALSHLPKQTQHAVAIPPRSSDGDEG